MSDIIKKLKIKPFIINLSQEEHDIIKLESMKRGVFMKKLILDAVADWINKTIKESS